MQRFQNLNKKVTLIFLFGIIALISPLRSFACDICGCFMGITPYDNQSTLGIMHRYRIFNGYQGLNQKKKFFPDGVRVFYPSPWQETGAGHTHQPGTGPHTHGDNPQDYEAFRVVELRGKYFIHKRLELNAYVPLNMNSSRTEGSTSSVSGIGDVNLFAGFHLLRQIEVAGAQQRLIVGGGLKLPTGHYYRKDAAGTRYPLLLQTGTGSVDYFGYLNYIIGYRKLGLSLNSSYKINGQNYYHEGIANSSAHFANLFYRYMPNLNWQIIPSAQFFYEYTPGETLNGEHTGEHRMNNALLGPGLDIFYKNFSVNMGAQFPVYEATTEHPTSAGRLVLGLNYSFNQKSYLLKSK